MVGFLSDGPERSIKISSRSYLADVRFSILSMKFVFMYHKSRRMERYGGGARVQCHDLLATELSTIGRASLVRRLRNKPSQRGSAR